MIKLIITGRLAVDKSAADALAHMRDVHGPLVYDPPADAGPMPSRYAQNHGVAGVADLGGWRSERQFVTEIWFDDIAHLKAATSTRYYLQTLRPDESNFVDQTSVQAVATEPGARGGEAPRDATRLFVFLKRGAACAPAAWSSACAEALADWSAEAPAWEIDDALPAPPGRPALADRVASLSFGDRRAAIGFAGARMAALAGRLAPFVDASGCFAVLADAYPEERLRRSRRAGA